MSQPRTVTVSYVSTAASGTRALPRRTLMLEEGAPLGAMGGSGPRLGGTLKASRLSERKPRPLGGNGAVPLKRITAGRKELNILHDGATYLLRITKANKLILTKVAAVPA